jgi:hypothetical protein
MKRLTKAQSELIDAFLAEHAARVSTAQLEKDFLISEVFSAFTEPLVYQGHEAKFVLCGGTHFPGNTGLQDNKMPLDTLRLSVTPRDECAGQKSPASGTQDPTRPRLVLRVTDANVRIVRAL